MTGHLLDTNILILSLRNDQRVVELIAQLSADGAVAISIATRAEVMAGMHAHEETKTRALLDSFINLPINVPIADRAGRWVYQYARRGLQLSFPDALIAASAVQAELTLVTTNAKHFPMPELKLQTVS